MVKMAAGGSEGNELPSHPAAKGRVYILEGVRATTPLVLRR